MKKYKTIKKITASVVAIASTFIYSTTAFAGTGVIAITSGTLNLRALPDVNSEVVATFENGTEIEVIGFEDDFFTVNHNGEKRYISKNFVSLKTSDGVVTTNGVNIRTAPETGGVIAVANSGDVLTTTGYENGWYQIDINGEVGYISSSYLTDDLSSFLGGFSQESLVNEAPEISTYGLVTASGVNLRSDMNTDSNVLTVLGEGAVVDVEQTSEEWIEVSYANQTGYISSDYLEVNVGEKPATSTVGDELITYAQQFIGTPYLWGGTNLNSGVDCSGFTQSVFSAFGVPINRIAVDQYSNGYRVSKDELIAGDLVFFDTSGGNNGEITHVGIYMGDGNFIHSSSSSSGIGVTISPLSKNYYVNAYVGATRVLN